MIELLKSEPVALQGLVVALITTGTAFGLHWSAEQVAAVTGLSAVILSVITRTQVSPK
jgi:hypothetical protein